MQVAQQGAVDIADDQLAAVALDRTDVQVFFIGVAVDNMAIPTLDDCLAILPTGDPAQDPAKQEFMGVDSVWHD
ncbi:hypothetical protein D3C86_1335030 [compost metagenome]